MKRPRRLLRRLAVLAAGLLAIVIMLFWFERRQVFQPSRTMFATGRELNRPYEEVTCRVDGQSLYGWFFPAKTNSPYRDLALLYCHGNGGNICHRMEAVEALLETGLNVLIFDYRGYGRSEGRPTEEGTYRDAEAASAWLRGRGFAATNLIAYGESLGGGVASELARREPGAGLILQSTFTSIPDIGAELFPWLPVRTFSRIKYDTHSRLKQIRVPVLVMHSREDGLIRFEHAERNFAAASEPKLFREIGGGHNAPLTDRPKYIAAVQDLLKLIADGRNGR